MARKKLNLPEVVGRTRNPIDIPSLWGLLNPKPPERTLGGCCGSAHSETARPRQGARASLGADSDGTLAFATRAAWAWKASSPNAAANRIGPGAARIGSR